MSVRARVRACVRPVRRPDHGAIYRPLGSNPGKLGICPVEEAACVRGAGGRLRCVEMGVGQAVS